MKRKIALFTGLLLACTMAIPNVSLAKEKTELTAIEIDQLLENTDAIEIEEGIYLRDNGEVSIIDIDASLFQTNETSDTIVLSQADFMSNLTMQSRIWDLTSSSYIASFSCKYRVFTKETFKGYNTMYTHVYDLKCPSDSTWKVTLWEGTKKIVDSPVYSYTDKNIAVKFYNLSTTANYRFSFQKTDNGSNATGVIKVYK